MNQQIGTLKDALVYLQTTVRVRVMDFGGWLDTWFAEHGQVVNLAVLSRPFGSSGEYLGVDILFRLDTSTKISKDSSGKIILIASSDPTFNVTRERNLIKPTDSECRKNLLLAALSQCELEKLPAGDLVFRIESPIPPGASMGTSAAVSVGLIKAMNELRMIYKLGSWTADEIATKAFLAETEVMGGQSGTQDQWSAAFPWPSKIIRIEKYPKTIARPLTLNKKFKTLLEQGLITVCVGSHNSSDTHLKVIAAREAEGANSEALQPIRDAVEIAIKAIENSDQLALGRAMIANTEGQHKMCAELVGSHHRRVIELAQRCGCLGYKVNGAGGEGGSVTMLFPDRAGSEAYHTKLSEVHPEYLSFEHKL